MGFFRHFSYFLYITLGQLMPSSSSKIGKFFKAGFFRASLARGYIKKCGKKVNIDKHSEFSSHLSIGDYSGIGKNSFLQGEVTIGNYVLMGAECFIYTRNHSFENANSTIYEQGFQESRPVVIEDDVWIGGRVIILPGVHVGKGAVIGAGSVVTKDVPNYCVVAGNPARIIKKRI